MVAHFGWTDLIYTHISARAPDEEGVFLLNPFGFLFDEITASSLIKVDIDGNPVMILRNHGLLAVGDTIPMAFSNMFNLQFACETQVMALSGGADVTMPPMNVSEHTASLAVADDAPFGDKEWKALLRMLDRKQSIYAQ